MRLSPHEVDKLSLSNVGFVAQKRLASGVRLNIPESIALLVYQVLELARSGKYSVAHLMSLGRTMLGQRHVLPGVASVLSEVQIEATFPDGTKLVTLHDPIASSNGDLELCLKGSFLPIPSPTLFGPHTEEGLIPGAVHTLEGNIVLNAGRASVCLKVINCSDRPIQVGSHYHFIETNPMLCFDRRASYGKRLNIAAGTAVRFEPGEAKTVSLVDIGGLRHIYGGNGLCEGVVDPAAIDGIMQKLLQQGFLDINSPSASVVPVEGVKRRKVDPSALEAVRKDLKSIPAASSNAPATLTRAQYSHMFGPTTGDIVRLADTELYIRVENDYTVYGDECKFGGGKTLREGMGQIAGLVAADVLDTVITNALIVDYTGIYKADIGIKNGLISGIGKAGNYHTMDGVTAGMVVGVNTEVIAGEGLIITAGGADTHIHFICPQICEEAICSGLTTLLGGGTGPASGTCATTCTPSPNHMRMMLQATDGIPINLAFTGKGNTANANGLYDIIDAGAVGLKLHEDWGTTPAAIRKCLEVADECDVQVTIHTDTLNESCCLEGTVDAIAGRTIHTYHSEGAGGGHAPDIIAICSQPNVIPSSTNPTRPLTVNTIDEHLDMLMVCHHLDKSIPEDIAFAESRIRMETIAAEDLLHDMGAISIVSSDSQAMGRVGEVIMRTWQTADKMKRQVGQLKEDAAADAAFPSNPLPHQCFDPTRAKQPIQTDNFRVKRYIAKYTINPCIAHGMSKHIGSVEVGKLADLVLWKPAFFGAKAEMIIKGGYIAYSQMGDANASIPTPEPVIMRPMFAALGSVASTSSIAFVSKRSVEKNVIDDYKLHKQVIPVENTRSIGKKDMKLNDSMPAISVDPETYLVTADGVHLTCEPVNSVPLSQRYFIF